MKTVGGLIVGWIRGQSTSRWLVFQAIQNLTNVVLTTVLVTSAISADKAWSKVLFWVLAAAAVLLLSALAGKLGKIREATFPDHPQMVLSMTRAVADAMTDENKLAQPNSLRERVADARKRIDIYLKAFRRVIAETWSIEQYGQTTEVDVVIMTRAEDGYVTVGAWAGDKPLSLASRLENPRYYENTEAAKLFRQYVDNRKRAPILIIPDVSKYSDYDHFGRDASLWTKSTILLPLYDNESSSHGFVAVTARKRTGLFREEERGFWQEAWRLWEPQLIRQILTLKALDARLEKP